MIFIITLSTSVHVTYCNVRNSLYIVMSLHLAFSVISYWFVCYYKSSVRTDFIIRIECVQPLRIIYCETVRYHIRIQATSRGWQPLVCSVGSMSSTVQKTSTTGPSMSNGWSTFLWRTASTMRRRSVYIGHWP